MIHRAACNATTVLSSLLKELEIIYESLYPSADDGRRGVWARPYSMFESKVDFEKYPNAMQEYGMESVEIQDVLV